MHIDEMLPPLDARPALIFTAPEIRFPRCVNLAEWMVDRHVEADRADDVALVQYDDPSGATSTITYGALRDRYRRIAGALDRTGVEPGERVLIGMRESIDAVATMLATFAVGAVGVPFTTMARRNDIAEYMEDLKPSVAVVDASLLDEASTLVSGGPQWFAVGGQSQGIASFDDLLSSPGRERPATTDRDDWAIVFHTAGTTGRSKPCVHSHRSLLAGAILSNAANLGHHEGPEASVRPVCCTVGPIGHAYGWLTKVLAPLVAGGTGVVMSTISAEVLHRVLKDDVLTHLFGAASIFKRFLLDQPVDHLDWSSLRLQRIFSLMHEERINNRLWELTGRKPLNVYGAAPLGAIVSGADCGEPFGSLGAPLPGFEVAIVDPTTPSIFDEAGRVADLPDGELGRLALRGPVGTTYLNRPDLAVEEIQAGWTITDDLFTRVDGFLHFQGRVSGVIKTSGYSVAPGEVEACLCRHPSVERCAVIGVPDMDRTEVVKAFIQTIPGVSADDALTAELQAHVRKELTPYKYPRLVEYMDEIPMDATGKVPYGRLRRREAKRAELDSASAE